MQKIKLGVIGANVSRGWASRAHLPAIMALDDFELTAVCTTRQETADEAAAKFGAHRAYDSADKLIADPDIDAVAVVVRIDRHYGPVMAALKAKKHVLCEWPLGHSTREAEEMTELAGKQGVVNQVGFQTRRNVARRHMQALIEAGFIGDLRSVTMTATVTRWGADMPLETIYGADEKIGVNVFNIQGGHSFDALCYSFGDFSALNATVASLRNETRVIETGEVVPFTAPDQVIVNGTLECGAVVSAHLQSGALNYPGFRMVVRGTEGELVLSGEDVVPTSELKLEGIKRGEKEPADLRKIVPVPTVDGNLAGLPQVTASIAESYQAFADAIRDGKDASPSFAEALARHRLLDSIRKASDTGQRQRI